ncbi:MAG: hypothetical protein HOB38_27200 [Deltaproteobacteria bacterium]|nr:hypothetical protein [Deltaproteobacteria bacterium]
MAKIRFLKAIFGCSIIITYNACCNPSILKVCLWDLMLDKPVVPRLGMTGELTLTGEVLPIGGLKEKIIAARRAGLTKIVIPAQNKKDYLELPDHLKEKIQVFYAKKYQDVFKIAFDNPRLKC